MSRAPYLLAHGLSLTLPHGRALFTDLHLSVGSGRTALVGANGTGKSILLECLAGVRPPTAGDVVHRGAVGWLPQGARLRPRYPGETVAERLGVGHRLAALARILDGGSDPGDFDAVGACGWDLQPRVRARLDALGLGHLSLERSVAGLSGGELARVSLAGAFLREPDVLLLDEPTNDLDAESCDALLASLDGWGGGVLVVSHHRALLRRVDRILELTPAGLREHGGNYDHYAAVREVRDQAAREELAQARAALRRARVHAREAKERQARRTARGARSRGDGSQPSVVLNARRERSQGTARRLDAALKASLEGTAHRVAEAEARVAEAGTLRMDVRPSGLPASRDVLVMEDVRYAPPGSGRPLLQGVSLRVRGPDRVAVAGRNGSGKSTLLRLVAGELAPEEGAVRLCVPGTRVVWLGQDGKMRPAGALQTPSARPAHARAEGHTVLSSFLEAHPEVEEGEARHRLARYLFPGDTALTPVGALSGGERVRAALACALAGNRTPWLLILDEPTNHLDLPSLEAVERAVGEYDGALLVVSHDQDFLSGVGVVRTLTLGG